jgi:hypothetical protein
MIIWRKIGTINQFRVALHQLIEAKGDELILSSGYVSHGSQFSVYDQSNILPSMKVAIANGLKNVTIRAGKFRRFSQSTPTSLNALHHNINGNSSYQERYEEFLYNLIPFLKSNLTSININAYIHNNWHAKVAVRADQGRPFAAIIGSSNLTSTAYGVYPNNYNWECDVLIWRADYPVIREFSFSYDENREGKDDKIIHFASKSDYFYFEYLPERDEESRLIGIYNEVKNAEGGIRTPTD